MTDSPTLAQTPLGYGTMRSRSEVVAMVRSRIRLRHYALSTEGAYCQWTGRYYDFCLHLPREYSPERKAEEFLTDLAKRWVSAKTQNQALAALLFLYKEVLSRPLGAIDALRAKRPKHERQAPSRDEVRRFRAVVKDTPHTPVKLLVDLIYGCGLRVSEPLDLRIQDVLWGEGQLMIRGAKGGKDRRVPIPAACAEPLRRQVDHAQAAWREDRVQNAGIGVPLPGRLAQKYPTAAFTVQWFWVFPAATYCQDPYSGKMVRFHILIDSLQRAVHAASLDAGLGHLITPHVLRHAYATHSRESIEALRQLMGHSSIETTAGYRHAVVDGASNPLDDMVASNEPFQHRSPARPERSTHSTESFASTGSQLPWNAHGGTLSSSSSEADLASAYD